MHAKTFESHTEYKGLQCALSDQLCEMNLTSCMNKSGHYMAFAKTRGSATSNEANKSARLRAEWTITVRQAVLCLAQMKYRYFDPEFGPEICKQNAIFQVQAIKTGHISVIYRKTGDKLLVGSTGTAAAW